MLKGKMKGSYCSRFLAAGRTGLLGAVIFIFTQSASVAQAPLCARHCPGTGDDALHRTTAKGVRFYSVWKLACPAYRYWQEDRTPGPETKNFTAHSTADTTAARATFAQGCLLPWKSPGVVRNSQDGCCTCSESVSQIGNSKQEISVFERGC